MALSLSFGGSKKKSKQTTYTKTPEQRKAMTSLFGAYLPQVGQNQAYTGDRVAPLTDLQRTTLGGAQNYANYFSTPQTVGTPLFAETGAAAKSLLDGTAGATKLSDSNVSDYFDSTYRAPAMTALRDDINPAIDEAYAGPGFWHSQRSHEKADAAADTSRWLGEQYGQVKWDQQLNNQALDEAKANRTLSAMPTAMAYGQQPAAEVMNNLQIAASQVQGLSDLFGFGAAEQSQEQRELAAEMAQFMEAKQITDPETLNILLSLINEQAYSQTKASGSSFNWQASRTPNA